MIISVCSQCGVEWRSVGVGGDVCARCAQLGADAARHLLADAPPLPADDIEAIKVIMMQTGWKWEEE